MKGGVTDNGGRWRKGGEGNEGKRQWVGGRGKGGGVVLAKRIYLDVVGVKLCFYLCLIDNLYLPGVLYRFINSIQNCCCLQQISLSSDIIIIVPAIQVTARKI